MKGGGSSAERKGPIAQYLSAEAMNGPVGGNGRKCCSSEQGKQRSFHDGDRECVCFVLEMARIDLFCFQRELLKLIIVIRYHQMASVRLG